MHENTGPKLTGKALEAHEYALARGADCHHCPIGPFLHQGPVPSTIVRNAKLAIIGEAPGIQECSHGENFFGPSGRVLDASLEMGGLDRKQCTVVNTIACRPPKGDFSEMEKALKAKHKAAVLRSEAGEGPDPGPLYLPSECCRPRLERDLQETNTNTYLAVGAQALKAVAGYFNLPYGKKRKHNKDDRPIVKSISQQRGHPVTTPEGQFLVASYHPAFAMREGSRQFMPAVRNDIARAAKIAVRGYVDWRDPKGIIDPDIETVEEISTLFVNRRVEVTLDIETDGLDPRKCNLRVVGLGAMIDGREVCIAVPFRHKNGDAWWDEQDELRAKKAVRYVLNRCELNGHNVVSYDSLVLLRLGFLDDRTKLFGDSLILDKNSDACDLPHRLEAVASRYFELPSWKISHDNDKYDGEQNEASFQDDLDYAQYNVKDVATTMRLMPCLRDRVIRCGSTKQYEIDKRLAPIFRDMGDLGLCYDMRRRRNIAEVLDAEISRREAIVKGIIWKSCGVDTFNVRSTAQIKQFLYDHKRLVPLLNTKGEEWAEGETASSSSGALLSLLAKGVDDETKAFIEAVLRFRAYEKQAATYSGRIAKEDDPKGTYKRGDLIQGLPIDWDDYRDIGYGVLPMLHATYRLSISSGRVSAAGGVQTIPEVSRVGVCYECLGTGEFNGSACKICWDKEAKRARYCLACGGLKDPSCPVCLGDGKTRAPMNLRAMFCAAPGHVLVGADFDALELRGMTAITQDKTFLRILNSLIDGKPIDPHMYNFCTLVCTSQTEIDKLYRDMVARGGKDNKEIKQLRGYAKVFCIAEDEPVLTDGGLIPIQDVKITDLLWDGIEWVTHQGVIYKGEQEVIEYEGLRATPDHQVWCEDGEKTTLQEAVREGRALARTGRGRNPIRFQRSPAQTRAKSLAKNHGTVKIYDILNAGPRRRFTVAGYLVSNCFSLFYGAFPDKVFSYMSTVRNKATGELEFPDLAKDPARGLAKCQFWYRNFMAVHPELTAYHLRMRRQAERDGHVSSPISGRRRFFPGGLNSPNMVYNHSNQALAGDFTNESTEKIVRLIPFREWSPLTGLNLQVHDFLGGQVPEDRVQEARLIFKENMTYHYADVSFTATPTSGRYWSEL